MPTWSPYFSYPDLTFHAAFTGGANFDLATIDSTDPTTPIDTGAYSAVTWPAAPLRAYNNGTGTLWTQMFVHLDLAAFVVSRASDQPDYPYPYPDAQINGWEREGETTLFAASSKTFAQLAAEINRFRFAFDVTDVTAANFGGYTPDDVTVWVKPWLPADLTYHDHTGFPSGSAPGTRFAAAAELTATGNYATSGNVLPSGSTTTTVGTADMLPSTFLDTVDHHGGISGGQFLCFTVAFAEQISPGAFAAGHARDLRTDNVVLDAQWARDRFRFQLKQVRLRQYPRDDSLGGAPRQGHGSTSTQASPRQGYSNTYR